MTRLDHDGPHQFVDHQCTMCGQLETGLTRQEGVMGKAGSPGSGVPSVPWQVTLHADYVADYPGHAFIVADPEGMCRSVCDGFIDDMVWIGALHNTTLRSDWRARLAWWLLRRPHRPSRRTR